MTGFLARIRDLAREIDAECGAGTAAREAFGFIFIGLALPVVAVGLALLLEDFPC